MTSFSQEDTRSCPSPMINSLSSNFPKTDRIKQMEAINKEGLELFKGKNADYGDAFAKYGSVGVIVRMGDKIARLQSITSSSVSLINSESIRDTLIDLHNYSAMAIMLLDDNNPKQDHPKQGQLNQKQYNPIQTTYINHNTDAMSCNDMAWNFMKYKNTLSDHKPQSK